MFCFFNGLPQEERHRTESVKSGVTGAVLEEHGVFEMQREDRAGEFAASCGRNADLRALAQTLNDIPEPIKRRRWKRFSAASNHGQSEEVAQLVIGPAFLVAQSFSKRPSNLSLRGVSVQSAKELLKARLEIQAVKDELLAVTVVGPVRERIHCAGRTKLDTRPSGVRNALFKKRQQLEQVFLIGNQWFRMVGEWEGDDARAHKPALDQTEGNCILKWLPCPAQCKNHRLIPIGSLQSGEPFRCMKNRGARVAQNEFSPTRVGNGVDLFEQERNVSTPGDLG